MVQSGIGRGEHVALLGENSPAWVLHYLAVAMAGAVVVPLDSMMSATEIANILQHSRSRALIASRKFRELLRSIAEEHEITVYALESDAYPKSTPFRGYQT